MFSFFFVAITICFMRNESRIYRIATDTKAVLYKNDINSVTNTAKVNKYVRKGSVVVKKFIAHFRTIKLLFLLKIYHCEI